MTDTVLRDLIAARNDDPFVSGLFGGLPKTATSASAISTGDTTVPVSPSETVTSSSVPATGLSFARQKGTQRSRGDIRDTGATDKKASNATSSATKARTSRRSLSDRLTPSLISAGLVKGITPSSTRKQSGQPILVLAFDTPAGAAAEKPHSGFSYSSGRDRAIEARRKETSE